MAEVLTGVNGDVIRWARKLYNMTPEDAATSIGVDLPQYLQWESGTEYPTYSKLKEISRVFRRVPKRGENSEQGVKSLKKRKMPLQAFPFPEYVILPYCSFPL